MKLITILESSNKVEQMLKQQRAAANLELQDILKSVPEKDKLASFIEKAVLKRDLSKDQRFWEQLAVMLQVPAGDGSDFKRSLQTALGQKVEIKKGEAEPKKQVSLLGGLQSAMNMYLRAFAEVYNLPSLTGQETLVQKNIQILDTFLLNFARSQTFKMLGRS